MEKLRKVSLVLSVIAFAVCELFLNLLGGIGILMNKGDGQYTPIYDTSGKCLMICTAVFGLALVLAFFRKLWANLGCVVLNIAAAVLYIIPIRLLDSIPNAVVPKLQMEVIINRIYPSIILTILLAVVVFADVLSYDRSVKRAEKRGRRITEKNRPLKDNEKII